MFFCYIGIKHIFNVFLDLCNLNTNGKNIYF